MPQDCAAERLLRDPRSGVNVALIQAGSINASEAPELESLGTLFSEPLWIFHRSELRVLTTDDLRGRKVSIGPLGSGTYTLSFEVRQVFPATGRSYQSDLHAGTFERRLILPANLLEAASLRPGCHHDGARRHCG